MKDTASPPSFDALFSRPEVARDLRDVYPGAYDVAAGFWQAPQDNPHLTPRMRELVMLAIQGAATALNTHAIARHTARAEAAGATRAEIVDALVTISTMANHALYASVPILEEEWQAAGLPMPEAGAEDPGLAAARQRFVDIRGFWNPDRDPIARQMPEYFRALTELSVETWQNGALSRKEREFLCIAIDCSVTHSYGPGLRLHIRNAIDAGATREEILAVFQLAAMLGLEGYILAGEAMFAKTAG